MGAVSEGQDRQHCHPGFSRLFCRHQAADRYPRAGGKSPDNRLEFVNDDFKDMLTELKIKRELTPVDGAKRNERVERKMALITERTRVAWLEFPRHLPDLRFPRKALIWDKIWPEAFSWMNDCINISARVEDKLDVLCPWEKLYGRRSTLLVLPSMMQGVRHANRKTNMHSKGERYFYLNTGHDHSSTAHKVLLASGVASYTADITFGYRRRPFVGEPPTWGDGAVVSSPPSPQQPQLMGARGGAGRWSISERGRSSNSGRRIQWEPGRCRGGGAAVDESWGRCRGGGAAVEGSRGRGRGSGASVSAAAAATAAAAFNGSRGRCRGGGASASAAAAATAAAASNRSRGRCRGDGTSASAAAAAITAAAFNECRGRGRGRGDTATAAVAAAGAGTVGGDRKSGCGDFGDGPVATGSRRAHRRRGTIPGGGLERERRRRHSRGGSRSTWWCRRFRRDRYSSSGTA